MTMNNKKAVVVGASSGIGEALARVLGRNGYEVGLAARRIELLRQIQKEIPAQTYVKQIDVSKPGVALRVLPIMPLKPLSLTIFKG